MENRKVVFIEFVTNTNQRMLIDFFDIRGVREGNAESDKGYCKIFFHSNVETFQWVKSDYEGLVNKMTAVLQSLNN
jgi:hypothetical protein